MGSRPNFVFIHSDSMDGRAMGCMGHRPLANGTPACDRVASEGTLFRRTYCNIPICCPSRASMWSGQYPHHCEGWNNYKGLEPGSPTLLDRLAEGGYRTQICGKTDWTSGRHTVRARVSPWTRSCGIARPHYTMPPPEILPPGKRPHKRDWDNLEQSIAFLEQAVADDVPFFLNFAPAQPHPPFRISPDYLDMVDEDAIELPADDHYDHPVLAYQRRIKNWPHGFSPEIAHNVRHIYYAMIAEVDAMIGELLAAIDRLGLADSTIVIISSDHGELALEHRQNFKMSPFEGSARVPLIIRGPGLQRGAQTDHLTSLVDLYPTVLDLAGLPHPDGLDGHSLAPELHGESPQRPDHALLQFHGTTMSTGCFMLAKDDWKYIAFAGYDPLLFNLKTDPHETRNLAPDEPQLVARLDAELRQLVDIEAVDAKVKDYDKASFRQWRQQARQDGTYETTMARIFSGWQPIEDDHPPPWTSDLEANIEQWLTN